MRKFFLTAFVLAAMLVFATSSFGLERTAARTSADMGDRSWNAGSSCSIAYYNTCTGWVWIWSGFLGGDTVGTCFDNCCPSGSGTLNASFVFVWTAAPSGYGFTGTAHANDATADCCPTAGGLSQPYLPISGWNTYLWGNTVGAQFTVDYTHGISSFPNPTAYASGHPAAGPTGPAACGTCYPTDRVAHSYSWGAAASPLCPGSTLDDGVCDAEWLAAVVLSCNPVSVEEQTWGKIKGLYR